MGLEYRKYIILTSLISVDRLSGKTYHSLKGSDFWCKIVTSYCYKSAHVAHSITVRKHSELVQFLWLQLRYTYQ